MEKCLNLRCTSLIRRLHGLYMYTCVTHSIVVKCQKFYFQYNTNIYFQEEITKNSKM